MWMCDASVAIGRPFGLTVLVGIDGQVEVPTAGAAPSSEPICTPVTAVVRVKRLDSSRVQAPSRRTKKLGSAMRNAVFTIGPPGQEHELSLAGIPREVVENFRGVASMEQRFGVSRT